MPWLERIALSLRLMRREIAAGELSLLVIALVIAVSAFSSVSFFADRVERGLRLQATHLLAADLVVNADHAALQPYRDQARAAGLSTAETVTFPSMVLAGGRSQLATFKAVSAGYPLRGELSVQFADRIQHGQLQPAVGTVWMDARLMQKLGVALGDTLTLGAADFVLQGQLVREPDGAMDLYNFIPRLMLNQQDLARTGLIQTGSRARWRVLVAGAPSAVEALRLDLLPKLKRGERLDNIEEARPEIRVALERATRFLGLTALLAVMLSAAAVSLACRRYLTRHTASVAVMRCLGAGQGEILSLFLFQFAGLAVVAGVLGTCLGWVAQAAAVSQLAAGLTDNLPQPGLQPWLSGMALGGVLLFGFAVPPLLALKRTPTLRVFRDEPVPTHLGRSGYLLGGLTLCGLMAWQAGEPKLAVLVLLGFAVFLLVAGAGAWGLVSLLRRLPSGGKVGWRFGLANAARRQGLTVVQIVALAVGMMALLVLTIVKNDVLTAWHSTLPADAPNRFVINIQPPQRAGIEALFAAQGLPAPQFAPMVRARLLFINDQAVRPESYADDRAQRLAEREFNLSWTDTLPADNRSVAGSPWGGSGDAFSVEVGLADTLGIKLGDVLRFDIAGTEYQAPVTHLRKVNWDSFKVNFFVYGSPSLLGKQAASYLTSFYLPPDREAAMSALVQAFPNLTVMDVGAILAEVRRLLDRLTWAIEAVFGFSLAAGVLVLWAATLATHDERALDAAMLRTLGASYRQLRTIALAEFVWLGGVAGGLAALGALGLSAVVSVQMLEVPMRLNLWLLPIGVGGGAVMATLAGWPTTRRLLRVPPLWVLRQLG